MMTMPHSPGSGLPGNPGNAPVDPGTVLGNPYADMQPAPQVAAPPGQGLDAASICLGIIGLILGSTGRKRVQDPRHERMQKVGIWMNAAPMIMFLAAVMLTILFAMAY